MSVAVKEELEHLSFGVATGVGIKFTEVASAAVVKFIITSLVTDETKCAVIGHSLLK